MNLQEVLFDRNEAMEILNPRIMTTAALFAILDSRLNEYLRDHRFKDFQIMRIKRTMISAKGAIVLEIPDRINSNQIRMVVNSAQSLMRKMITSDGDCSLAIAIGDSIPRPLFCGHPITISLEKT